MADQKVAVQKTVQTLVEKRRRLLLVLLLTTDFWLGSRIVGDFFGANTTPFPWKTVLITVQLLSGLIWGISLVFLLQFAKTLARIPAAAALSDELWRQTRLKAAEFAFGVLLITEALLAGVAPAFHAVLSIAIPLKVGAEISLFVGFNAFVGAFLVLERE